MVGFVRLFSAIVLLVTLTNGSYSTLRLQMLEDKVNTITDYFEEKIKHLHVVVNNTRYVSGDMKAIEAEGAVNPPSRVSKFKVDIKTDGLIIRNAFKEEKQWLRNTSDNLKAENTEFQKEMTDKLNKVNDSITELNDTSTRLLNEFTSFREDIRNEIESMRASSKRHVDAIKFLGRGLKFERNIAVALILSEESIQFQNSYYVAVKTPLSWQDARKNCKFLGATLTEIDSQPEHDFLVEIARKKINNNIWIGGSDLQTESVWTWRSSGHTIGGSSYTNWAPGQPVVPQPLTNCLQMWKYLNYLWDDHVCDYPKASFCEVNLN